jgi:hypothetical protein
VTGAIDGERRAVAAALGEAAQLEMREVGVEDRLEIEVRRAEHVGGAESCGEDAEILIALGQASEAAECHRPRRVIRGATTG